MTLPLPLPLPFPSLSHIVLSGTLFVVGSACFYAVLWPLFSPLRVVPGPDKPHWLKGHSGHIIAETNSGDSERKWMANYGHVIKFKAFFNVRFRHSGPLRPFLMLHLGL
jgi:hypothetical protein